MIHSEEKIVLMSLTYIKLYKTVASQVIKINTTSNNVYDLNSHFSKK
jgi:hypothetical protein